MTPTEPTSSEVIIATGNTRTMPTERLWEESATLLDIVLALVPTDDAAMARAALSGYAERLFRIGTRSAGDLDATLASGRAAGLQAGARAGYQKGLADGLEKGKAEAKPAPAPTILFERDEKGRPVAFTEEHADGSMVRKLLERDGKGNVIRITPSVVG